MADEFGKQSSSKPSSGKQGVSVLELGPSPDMMSPGAAIVEGENQLFLSFAATSDGSSGQAVVELKGCVEWNSTVPGENPFATVDGDSLPICSFVEVTGSDRLATLANPKNSLRHFVVTFLGIEPGVCEGGRHFECVAEDMHVEFFREGSFDDILDYIDLVDASFDVSDSKGSNSKGPSSKEKDRGYDKAF
ncbi:MAG: hypothetical protein AAFU85_14635 [Planctomycetota bacterium]